jgi:hypothetical protein
MEPFMINEAIIDEDEYFIFDDVSSSSLEDNDASYVDSEGEEQSQALITVTPTQSLFTPNTVTSLFAQEQQQQIKTSLVAHLKPAKGRDDHYTIGEFPTSLLCNPYKYDLKLVGEINPGRLNSPATAAKSISDLLNQQRAVKDESEFLVVTLVDADTMAAPVVCTNTVNMNNTAIQAPMKKGNVSVESVTQVSSQERIIRFTFNLCSFHVKRRAFRLIVTNKNTGENIFVSSPFKTFARKRERNGSSSSAQQQQQLPKTMPAAATASMYFMNQPTSQKKKTRTLASARATPYPVVNIGKMNRYSPTEAVPEMHAPQYAQVPVAYATYPMYGHTSGFHAAGYTYPMESLLQNLGPQERTSLAIQLMSSLTPVERETVDFYLSCSGQCFTMNNGGAVKPEDVNACFISGQPNVNSRV